LAGERDIVQARHWLDQARARGVAEAETELAQLPKPAEREAPAS
jgi:TPR repeat protein